jgi:predicted ATPase
MAIHSSCSKNQNSLHNAIVRRLSPLIYRLQKQRRRQVLISTHSFDLLSDKGISAEELLLLSPTREGTTIGSAASDEEIQDLMEEGWSVGEAAFPKTEPKNGNLAPLELF